MFIISQLEEGVDFMGVEEWAITLKFLSDTLNIGGSDLGELEWATVDNVTSDILLQESDNFKCLLVSLDWSNEKLVAVALVVQKNLTLSSDFVLTGFVPGQVVLGVLQVFFELNSVLLGLD